MEGPEHNGAGPPEHEAPDWERLLRETEEFAQFQIDRLFWRGKKGGVLPDGYDANSIAAEAVEEVLREGASAEADVKVSPKSKAQSPKSVPALPTNLSCDLEDEHRTSSIEHRTLNNGTPHPGPPAIEISRTRANGPLTPTLSPSEGSEGEREKPSADGRFLNSMAVHPGPLPLGEGEGEEAAPQFSQSLKGRDCDKTFSPVEPPNQDEGTDPSPQPSPLRNLRKGRGGSLGSPFANRGSWRELQWRLNRWVLRIVGRLNHRKETKAMRNDLDLPLQPLSNCGQGEMGTMAESLPTPNVEAEWTAEDDEGKLERLKGEIAERLGADKRAKAVFECMCDGVLRNAQIAKALGMTEKAVKTARRRIKRRVAELDRERSTGG